jgi:hypothetical protein
MDSFLCSHKLQPLHLDIKLTFLYSHVQFVNSMHEKWNHVQILVITVSVLPKLKSIAFNSKQGRIFVPSDFFHWTKFYYTKKNVLKSLSLLLSCIYIIILLLPFNRFKSTFVSHASCLLQLLISSHSIFYTFILTLYVALSS